MTTREKVAFRGWNENLRLSNSEIELIVTLEVGPRVISYRRMNGPNVFKVFENQASGSGESDWMIRGGHRFWLGPEDPERCYLPDNDPVAAIELTSDATRFVTAPELKYGLQKELDIHLDPAGSGVTLIHRVTNLARESATFAPWALSAMAAGGRAIIPLPEKRPHPGHPRNARSAADFAPDQVMIGWPFLDLADPRWSFGSKMITLTQDSSRGPTKLGLRHRTGAVGYLLGETLFMKRFADQADGVYPDLGCNFETFTNEDMLELESLGPLTTLAHGESAEHRERWELADGFKAGLADTEILTDVLPRLLS